MLKTAIVTGASGGIGSAIAIKLVQNGYFVAAFYNKNQIGIKALEDSLKKDGLGGYLMPIQCDLTNSSEIQNAFNQFLTSFNHVDVLVNNAGKGLYKLATETSDEEWDDIFNVNTKSTAVLTKLVLGKMIERKKGKIINVSSIWGAVGASMEVAYSASKSAVIGYTKALAKEVAPSGINVNCICPGVIDTPMNSRFSNEEMQELINVIPLMRLGKTEEIANLVEFLASEKADYITGQIITVDGGFTL